MKTKLSLIALVLFAALLLVSCAPRARVGDLLSESQSVELGDAEEVRVQINFGAGDLQMAGGAGELLEAGFTYNVARLKPEVKYTSGTLVVRQPDTEGLPALQNITGFRNEWDLQFNESVPMDLSVDIGAGTSKLRLSGLSLTHFNVNLGAGTSTVDLSGGWARDLDGTIDTGAADITVVLPKDVGVRVEVDTGPTIVEYQDLIRDGNLYTNAAYGKSEVTVELKMEAGIGRINLEVEE